MTGAEDVVRTQILREHCPKCDGRGLAGGPDFERCDRCRGSGFLTRGTHDEASGMDAEVADPVMERLRSENASLRRALEGAAKSLGYVSRWKPSDGEDVFSLRAWATSRARMVYVALGVSPP